MNEEETLNPAKRGSFQSEISAPPPSPNLTFSPPESSQVPLVKPVSLNFEETAISPELAAELTNPSFYPSEYKALTTYPNSDETREEHMLHEWDRRLELHIAYNLVKFMTMENKGCLKPLIDKQAIFEQTWPSPRSIAKQDSVFRKIYANPTTDEEITAIKPLLQEALSLVKQIQEMVRALK